MSAFFLRNASAWQTSENDSAGEFVASASLYSRTTDTNPLSAKYRADLKSCSGLPRDQAPPCTKRTAGRALPETTTGGNSNIRRSRPAMFRYTEALGVAGWPVGSSAACAQDIAARSPSDTAQNRRNLRDIPGHLVSRIECLLVADSSSPVAVFEASGLASLAFPRKQMFEATATLGTPRCPISRQASEVRADIRLQCHSTLFAWSSSRVSRRQPVAPIDAERSRWPCRWPYENSRRPPTEKT
ncbi:hypothetical protein QFZ47_000500 [Variovorax paradoxus]|nr:hypothetical protein [Variovorax paradoxus]